MIPDSDELKLYDLATTIGPDWPELASALGVSDLDVMIIKADVQTTVERAYKMLRDWYWNSGSEASFSDVTVKIERILAQRNAVDKSSKFHGVRLLC